MASQSAWTERRRRRRRSAAIRRSRRPATKPATSRRAVASSTTDGCCGRWPTSTTCASGSQREVVRERAAERSRVAASGCPSSTTSTARSDHADADDSAPSARRGRPGRARPGARRARPARLPPLRGRRRAVRPGPARGGRRRSRPTRPPGTVVAVVRPGYGTRRAACCGRPRWSWPRPADGGSPRLLRGARRADATRDAGRDPARLPQAGPHVPPGRQQGPGRRGAVQGDLRGLRRALRSRDAPPLRRASGTTSARSPRASTRRRGLAPRPAAGRPRRGRRRAGRRARAGRRVVHGDSAAIDFEDLFGGLFGGGRRRSWGPIPGADQEAELDAHRRGGVPRRPPVDHPVRAGRPAHATTSTIPPGVTDGQRIRLAGQGGQGTGGAPPGDLYLVVRIAPHPRYRVDGRDLYVELPLTPWEAALGATVAVDTPGGEAKVQGARRARRAAGGCGCAAAACPTHAARPATSTPRSQIMVPPTLDRRRAPTVRGAGARVRPSTRGGSR